MNQLVSQNKIQASFELRMAIQNGKEQGLLIRFVLASCLSYFKGPCAHPPKSPPSVTVNLNASSCAFATSSTFGHTVFHQRLLPVSIECGTRYSLLAIDLVPVLLVSNFPVIVDACSLAQYVAGFLSLVTSIPPPKP